MAEQDQVLRSPGEYGAVTFATQKQSGIAPGPAGPYKVIVRFFSFPLFTSSVRSSPSLYPAALRPDDGRLIDRTILGALLTVTRRRPQRRRGHYSTQNVSTSGLSQINFSSLEIGVFPSDNLRSPESE